ncbi:MAG: TIGR01212 family radical SAM protein [Planctomycetota bacterium]|nr:TIGR01212 family radical SAM protein [Planctomycetota bacterium]
MSAANTLPFRTFAPWLRETFGRPMYRVALDAGSTCPNRDGSRGFGGCVYCDVEGSGTGALRTGKEIARQLETGLKRIARRDDDCGCIAYLQSYSNTYVEASRLEEVLAPIEIAIDEGQVGIVSIATRPDTLPDWSLDRLSKLAERVPVWVELGLESANDEVLEKIKRYHTAAEFMEGVERCHAAGLKTVGHAILGLPGDGRDGARKSAELLAAAGCEGVKVHNLMVLRKTELAKWWRDGDVEVLDPETYVSWLADFTERLLPDQVLHRITGDAPLEERLAPRWDLYKNAIREMLAAELGKRGTVQGSLHV